MKPDRLPPWNALSRSFAIINENVPLELRVLKLHLLTEAHLYRLLSFRLDIDEEHLPAMQFFGLAKLALGGDAFKTSLTKILALNDLRNEFAHEMDHDRLEPAFVKFCAKTNMFWPPYDVAGKPEQFAQLRASAVTSGAVICVNEVWTHLARLLVERLRVEGFDVSGLERTISESEQVIRTTQDRQNSLRTMFK